MINQLAIKYTNYLLDRLLIKESESEIYQYGIEILLSSIYTLISFFMLAILFFKLIDGIFFILFFIPIRLFSGGYHAESYLKCYLVTMLVFITTLLMSSILAIPLLIIQILSCISSIYIFIHSPFENKNHPLSKRRLKKNQHRARLLSFIQLSSVFILCYINPHLALLASLTLTAVALMIYIPKRKEVIYHA